MKERAWLGMITVVLLGQWFSDWADYQSLPQTPSQGYLGGPWEGVAGNTDTHLKFLAGDSDAQPGLGVLLFPSFILDECDQPLESQVPEKQLWLDRKCDSRYMQLGAQN